MGRHARNARIRIANGRITSLPHPCGSGDRPAAAIPCIPGWIESTYPAIAFRPQRRNSHQRRAAVDAAAGIAQAAWAQFDGRLYDGAKRRRPMEKHARCHSTDHAFRDPGCSLDRNHRRRCLGHAEQLRALVRARTADGADLIKIFDRRGQRTGAAPDVQPSSNSHHVRRRRAGGFGPWWHATVAGRQRQRVPDATKSQMRTMPREEIAVAVRGRSEVRPQVGLVGQNYSRTKRAISGVGNTPRKA